MRAELNAALDLDKHEAQVMADDRESQEKNVPATLVARVSGEDRDAAMAP